jgi:hypothetical protein
VVIECVPEVCYQAWLEGEVLAAKSLLGRLQRQLCLFNLGVDISDPMDFFEEITRHRVLHGLVDEGGVWTANQVQCNAAAFLAWQLIHQSDRLVGLGLRRRGTLPFHPC